MRGVIAALGLSLLATTAGAQTASDVHFQPGTSSATISGTVIGQEYVDYRLGAKAGQTINVSLRVAGTNGNGTIYFNILPPGSDGEAIHVGSRDGNDASVTLPSDGEYAIRVYLMGNDADTGKTVGFEMPVSID